MKAEFYHKIANLTQMESYMFIVLPALCPICRQYHRNQHAICQACMALLDPLGPACDLCAIPLPQPTPLICGACSVKPPDIDRVFTAYRFTEPLRTLLHAFKYEAALYLTSFLTTLMLEAIEGDYTTQCLIPVPLHSKRLQTRGFNQATILAKQLSMLIQKPYSLYSCNKILPTVAQASLPAKQRRSNLSHAFQAKSLPYQHITLIDDLFTTGATANELARTLKQTGVQRVDLWCCARTC